MSTGATAILSCTCNHAFQDARYGSKRRVHNPILKPQPGFRCTVCGKIRQGESSHKKDVAISKETKTKEKAK